jgi:hypothetical protein
VLTVYFCYWGAGLVVTGRTRDIEENVLQPSFQIGSNSSPIYYQSFFLIAIHDEDLLEILYKSILRIRYTTIIVICNNYNSVNDNIYGRL